MRARMKSILLLILISICTLLAFWIALDFVVKQIDLPTILNRIISKETGHQLIIKEKPKVSIFPRVKVTLKDVTLTDPPPFTGFALATAKDVVIEMEILPLLFHHLKAEKIFIQGVVVYLYVEQHGQKNWLHWMQNTNPTNVSLDILQHSLDHVPGLGVVNQALSIENHKPDITNFEIQNAQLYYVNLQDKFKWSLANINVKAQHIKLHKPFPIVIDCQYHPSDSPFNIMIHSEGDMKLEVLRNFYELKNSTTSFLIQHKNFPDMPLELKGKMIWNSDSDQVILSPLNINFFNFTSGGDVEINHMHFNPTYHFKLTSKNIDLENLFSDLNKVPYITGNLNLFLNAKTSGKTLSNFISNLYGSLKISLSDGIFTGFTLRELMSQTNMPRHVQLSDDLDERIFIRYLTADFNIEKGIFSNNNLKSRVSHSVDVYGTGKINLNDQSIHYSISFQQANPYANYSVPNLPILIQGPLTNPYFSMQINNAHT